MKFYKLKHNDKEVFLSSDEILLPTDFVSDYATITGLIPADGEKWEVCLVTPNEYCKHLMDKVYKAFSDELETIKQSWIAKTVDEICSTCYMAVYISDVLNVLDDADASGFNYEVLESWLKNPKDMVNIICNRIINHNCSSYNESICDYINQGLEE